MGNMVAAARICEHRHTGTNRDQLAVCQRMSDENWRYTSQRHNNSNECGVHEIAQFSEVTLLSESGLPSNQRSEKQASAETGRATEAQ